MKSYVPSVSQSNIFTNTIFINEVNFVKKIIRDTHYIIDKTNCNLCPSESLLQDPSALKILAKKSDWLYLFIQNKITQTNNNLYNIFLESKMDMNSIIGQELFKLTTINNSRSEFIHIILLLLELGADINQLINNNETLLHISAYSGNINLCITLIKKGADINIKNIQNKTPLDVIGDVFDNYLFRLSNSEKKIYQNLLRNTYIRENNWKRRKNFMQFLSFMKTNNYQLEKIFEIYDVLRYITSFI